MKLICDEQACTEVLDLLKLFYKVLDKIRVTGHECVHTANKNFYFASTAGAMQREFLVIDISEQDIWKLDKFQSNLRYRKQKVEIQGSQLVNSEREECFIYEKRNGNISESEYGTVDYIGELCNKEVQMDTCDLYLLIPGKLDKGEDSWNRISEKQREVFAVFQRNIDSCVEGEYNSQFAKRLSRKCIGEIVLEVYDLIEKRFHYQDALAGIVKHDTGICILEIIVQNCSIGGNKILNYYCGNQLKYIYEGKRYTLEELFEKLYLRRFGKKRSMVFSYGNAKDEEIINALANEEYPMGKIDGDFRRQLLDGNIAQYDTAEVYVSEETMFEKCKNINVFANQRLSYNAIEIFFVELILFQDAAIDKVYIDLLKEEEKQKNHESVELSMERCEEITFDMAQALRFADYEQFRFPTVRKSAQNVARYFGIAHVYEKYERNKNLLESMIQANRRKLMNRQDGIKNKFLFLLSAVAAVGTVGDIFYSIYQDRVGGGFSYVAAVAIIAVIYAIYKLVMQVFKQMVKRQ